MPENTSVFDTCGTLADGLVLHLQASGNLSRFQLVDRALSEEKEARLAGEVKLRKEVESMAKAIADSIRDADAEHAALVEAVHQRVVERIAQQVCVCVCVYVCACVSPCP